MAYVKDKRNCLSCVRHDKCNNFGWDVDKSDRALSMRCCSEWVNEKGLTYDTYRDTFHYKWKEFSDRHYGHSIRDVLIWWVFWLLGVIGIIGVFLECKVVEWNTRKLGKRG